MSLSPLKNRVEIGVESYLVFDADGEGGEGDLYAGSASGGSVYRITFSRAHESSPALSPDGAMLAFIRGGTSEDSSSHRIWVMNLLNGAERELPALGDGIHPERLGWSADGRTLYVRTSAGNYFTPAPPAKPDLKPATAGQGSGADTALSVMLGEPPQATVIRCPDGPGLCVPADSGAVQLLTSEGRDAFRWGADSVAYWLGDGIEVRPLGGGTTRLLRWTDVPTHPRGATQFPGVLPQ